MRTKSNIEKQEINIRAEYVLFRNIEESPMNAQQMDELEFIRLVKNLKRDGVLTSTPFLMEQPEKSKHMCVSGHHRIKAAIKAGIEGGICLISGPLEESTRVRIQLAHNDIHGNPNEDIVSILQQQLNEFDISLIDQSNIDSQIKEAQEVEIDVPDFQYINICLLSTSRERLVDLIMSLEKSKSINWLIEKPEYEKVRDLLSYAFDKGFKTPGQAFGKFLEIVEQHLEEVKR
jgi:hypothetical protein